MVKIFGREQPVWLALIAAVFQVVMSYGFDADRKVQGIVTAVIVFAFAVVTAVRSHDGIVALASGVTVALFSLFAAFNLHISAERQSLWLGVITVAGAFWLRGRVVNPTPPTVSPAGKLVE
jgi:hypothetical protein